MALEFSFNRTNLDLEDPLVLGGPVEGIPRVHRNTPRFTYTESTKTNPFLAAVTREGFSPLRREFLIREDNEPGPTFNSLFPNLGEFLNAPINPNADPTQFPSTTLGSTNIRGHFPTTGKAPELFTQKYSAENTYLDQINSQ